MRSLISLVSIVLSFGFSSLKAQEVKLPESWTLQECVDYAIENNIQIRSSLLQTEVTKNNLNSSRWNYAPDLSLFNSTGWSFGLNIDPVTNIPTRNDRFTSSLSLNSNWVLFDGGRKFNSIARNNHEYLASLYDLESIKNDITLNVTSAYLQTMLNKEILDIAIEQEGISQLQVEQTRKLVEAGSSPRGDLLQFQAQLARDEQNTVSARNALLIGKLQLANLLLLPEPEKFEIAQPEPRLPDAGWLAYQPGQVYTTALESQPSIKAAEERILSSEESIDLSQGGFFPTVSLQGRINTIYSDAIVEAIRTTDITYPTPAYDAMGNVIFIPTTQTIPNGFEPKDFNNQLSDNLSQFVGLNISMPLFSQMQVKNNVQNAKIQYEISQLQLEQEKNQLKQTIYQAHADAKASYNSYLAAEKSIEASRESFNYARERYELGAINQFDYETAKNSLAVAQSEMLRAKYDYIFKLKVLEFYLTNEIKL
jgi:outer membrane protein